MPKSDTWPGGVAMESLSNMDSAGSCDSVISVNSGCSDDSMEHLSAEERACLMYLEETIEALEVQEDSGLSNDEPDTEKMGRPKVDDISSFKSDGFGTAEPHALNQISEAQSFPVSAANTKGLISTSQNLMTQPKAPDTEAVTDGKIPSSATQTQVLCISTDGDGKPKIVPSTELCSGQSTKASEIELSLIPPPSDFMDRPYLHADQKKVQDHPPSAGVSHNKPGATIDLEQIRQRATAKKTSASSFMTQEKNMPPPEVPPIPSPSANQTSPLPESAVPRSPPAVAPKPKKLPPNIFLKSHKTPVAGFDGNSGHSVPTSSDRMLLDPQRVRFEALRKLGLLKSEEVDSGPALSPKLSPKTRSSWGAPPSPLSPAAPHTPPLTPSDTCLSSPPPASVPPLAAFSPSANSTGPDILPAPAAFSDSVGPLPSDNELSAGKDVSEAKVNTQVTTPPLTPSTLTEKLTLSKIICVKSATLERSGLGLSSYMGSQDSNEVGANEQRPSQLRNNRPRPASLGSRKEFSSTQGELLQPGHARNQEPNLRRSMPAHNALQHSGDSQKLPRSQGISVLICPRAENGEDRRKALKKLGLLRD